MLPTQLAMLKTGRGQLLIRSSEKESSVCACVWLCGSRLSPGVRGAMNTEVPWAGHEQEIEEVTTMEAARIIIVGGGFAGVTLAQHLNRRVARDVEVVVISSENHMVFTPMLAEVAGRSLSGFDVVAPGRQIAPRATWLTASVTSVDLKKNEVEYNRPDGTI